MRSSIVIDLSLVDYIVRRFYPDAEDTSARHLIGGRKEACMGNGEAKRWD